MHADSRLRALLTHRSRGKPQDVPKPSMVSPLTSVRCRCRTRSSAAGFAWTRHRVTVRPALHDSKASTRATGTRGEVVNYRENSEAPTCSTRVPGLTVRTASAQKLDRHQPGGLIVTLGYLPSLIALSVLRFEEAKRLSWISQRQIRAMKGAI
ncbi:hypothetical protein MPL3356_400008 [Mesorhizobium plurifarium]|uniref:Uncharacterized protein n=1 Tax=Mesorhizobium plurifarium TaxID=69974 RepID=A0A090E9S6_MESPL|nr:hypothetical protein MPL3356_400008 [Mesorhizobium plurifarium]